MCQKNSSELAGMVYTLTVCELKNDPYSSIVDLPMIYLSKMVIVVTSFSFFQIPERKYHPTFEFELSDIH